MPPFLKGSLVASRIMQTFSLLVYLSVHTVYCTYAFFCLRHFNYDIPVEGTNWQRFIFARSPFCTQYYVYNACNRYFCCVLYSRDNPTHEYCENKTLANKRQFTVIPLKRQLLSICSVLTLWYALGKHISTNHKHAKIAKIPDHLINKNYWLRHKIFIYFKFV